MKNYFAFILLLAVTFQFTSCRKDKSLDPPRVADLSAYPPEIFGTWKMGKMTIQDVHLPLYLNIDQNGQKYYNTRINTYETTTKTLFLSKDLKDKNILYNTDSTSLNAEYTGSTNLDQNTWFRNPNGKYSILCLSVYSVFEIEKLTSDVLIISTISGSDKITYYFFKNNNSFLVSPNQLEQKLLGLWYLKTKTRPDGTILATYDASKFMHLTTETDPANFSPYYFFTDSIVGHAFYGSSSIEFTDEDFNSKILGASRWYCKDMDNFLVSFSPAKIISITDDKLTIQLFSIFTSNIHYYNFER